VCDAVEARLLQASDVSTLRSMAQQAETEGAAAVFLTDGPLGDAIVLAAGISAATSRILLGVRVELTAEAHRHPTVLAREMTTLDHVCGGRSVLGFRGPFTDAVGEAIALCRAMWVDGVAASEGPHYPVAGAINRPRPPGPDSPLIALDLTDAAVGAPPEIVAQADYLLRPTGDPDVCLMQRA
jgi:alkanesulfonate monooxygenase SsuD/methylene tetrahydromethanopterin reductase-like flavin-dependent oxidoreductase (luciferase family)